MDDIFLFVSVPHFLRSASVTNLSLDRSSSSMVPSYDSSVSPPSSRAMSTTKSGTKLDHSEEERKILLVPDFLFLHLLLQRSIIIWQVWSTTCHLILLFPCRIPLN